MFVRHRCSDFDMSETFIASEGIVTGYGTVNVARYVPTPRISPPGEEPWGKCTRRRYARSWTLLCAWEFRL
jgi:acetyl-CoA carboxylase carboxyltransferase component